MKITEHLENWARAQRGGRGDSGRDSLISGVYAPTVHGTDDDSSVNLADAERVERAVRKLLPLDRKVLQMHFVWCAPPFVICRRLGLKVRPASVFDLALAHAKHAVGERLSEMQTQPPRPQYVSMQAIIDRLATMPLAQSQ